MSKVVVHNSPSVTVWYHPKSNIVHSQVHKFVTGKPFQDFLMAGYDALVKHKSKKWLSDDRSNSVLRQDDVEWGNQNWLPKCVAAGWKYWASISSKFFSDSTAAMAWLESQP